MNRGRILTLIALITMILLIQPVSARTPEELPTRAGTAITNQAKVKYNNLGGQSFEASSNIVMTTVSAVPGVDITDGSHKTSAPGTVIIFHHTLTNTGNAPEVINIDVANAAGLAIEVLHDSDLDMALTSADAPFADSDGDVLPDTGMIDLGDSVPIFLKVTIPSDAPLTIEAVLGITASSGLDSSVKDYAEDTVSVDEARPFIDVHDSPQYAYLGTEYEFDISFGNAGDIPFTSAKIVTMIPDGLEFVSTNSLFTCDLTGKTITWSLGDLGAGTSGSFSVKMRVISAGPGITYVKDEATLTGGNGTNLYDFETTGLVTTAPASITLVANPDVIVGDGKSQSLLIATVLDAIGNPVPDGTKVTFGTEAGAFLPNGLAAFTGSTIGGDVQVILVAPLMHGFEPVINLVVAKAGLPETGEAYDIVTITFSPAGILGIVWNSDLNQPVAGILVELLDGDGIVVYSTATGADGRYMLIAPAKGLYSVRVHTNEPEERGLVEMAVEVQEVQGAVWSTPCAILGRVFYDVADAAQTSSLQPLAGAKLSLYKDGMLLEQKVSDESGDFAFLDLPLGDYVLEAISQDGNTGFGGASLVYNGEVLIAEYIELYESGKVYDAANLAPIPGAEVALLFATGPLAGTPVPLPATPSLIQQDNPAYTDILGHYIFFAPQGDYVLKATAFGYIDFISKPFILTDPVVNSWIPMQLMSSSSLEIEKLSSRSAAAPNESVKFTLNWSNTSGAPLVGVQMVDKVPAELIVQEDTITGNGIYDPVERTITWYYGNISASAEIRTEAYFATVESMVEDGTEVLNRAIIVSKDGSKSAASVLLLTARKPGVEVSKAAGSTRVSTGDIVTYRIDVSNSAEVPSPMAAFNVVVEDMLPAGFTYMTGSTYIDGKKADDPTIIGSTLYWTLDDISVGGSRSIVYKACVGPGAILGSDSVNSVMVFGKGENGYLFEEGPASASVIVTGPAFSTLGSIIGKVFNDKDEDGYQDKDEEGIYGVELIMDDGMRVLTDKDGMYHIGQVKPGVRSIKLNKPSLPFGAEMTNSFKDATGISSSFFVDVYPSGTSRSDFAVKSVDSAASYSLKISIDAAGLALIKDGRCVIPVRVSYVNDGSAEISPAHVILAVSSSDESMEVTMPEGREAEIKGLMPGQTGQVSFLIAAAGAGKNYSSLLVAAAAYMPGTEDNASAILDRASTAIILYRDEPVTSVIGYSVGSPGSLSFAQLGHIAIRTASPLETGTKLLVNRLEVPKDNVGSTIRDGVQGNLILDYISVEINNGVNVLELVNEATRQTMASAVVLKSGRAEKVIMAHIATAESLNIGSRIAIAALAVDETGLPAGRFAGASFAATGAEFVGADLKPQEEGFQPAVGEWGNYDLMLNVTDSDAQLTLTSKIGESRAEADLSSIRPISKPAFITGTIELTHNLNDFHSSYIRAMTFLRKEFAGGVLTLRYDSVQDAADGLYSDAAEDTMFSLYGDTSAISNASPSASPFYAKFSAGGIYAMWGDFQPLYQDAELSSFKSKFTGFSAGASIKGFSFGAFVAPLKDGIATERIEADGTSGYFFLESLPVIAGSEAVYAILVSSENEDIVIERVTFRRAVDYAIDYETGSILLSKPLPSSDSLGNKYLLEVVYNTPGAEYSGLAAGGRLYTDFGAFDAGITAALQTDFISTDAVLGADLGLDLGPAFALKAETGVSFANGLYGGYAVKAGASSRAGRISLGLEALVTDGGFVKPGEGIVMNRQISLIGKAEVDKISPIILSLASANYWKGAAYNFSSDNKLKAGYRLPLKFDLSIGLQTSFTYDELTDSKGAIFDAFVELAPIPELTIAAYAQIAKIGSPVNGDGDYSLSITYRPSSRIGITLLYVTGLDSIDRYHKLAISADVAVTKMGKVFGKIDVPFSIPSTKVLSLGYQDAYKLCEGLKTDFLLEGSIGFKGTGVELGTTKISAAGALEYSAKSGFKAYLKQEVTYHAEEGFKSLTMLTLNGKPADWLTIVGKASGYYGNSPSREELPLTAEASFSMAARPDNTVYTGLLKVGAQYYRGDNLGMDEAAIVATAVTDWTLEAGKYLSLTTKAGYKLAAEGPIGEGLSVNSMMLVQAGASIHITKTTDVEGFIRAIGWADNWKLGYSVQVVQKIFNLFSVAAGYNSKELSDTDIADQKPWKEGFYLKALIKF